MKKPKPSRANKKGRNEQQYANVPYAMLKSDAWRHLDPSAMKVYWELRTRFTGYNNGRIGMSMRVAAETLGLSKSTVSRAIAQLEAHGFIAITAKGAFHRHQTNLYRFTDLRTDSGHATHDYKAWRAPKPKRRKNIGNGKPLYADLDQEAP